MTSTEISKSKIGIVLRGNKIWISELISIAFVFLLVIFLSFFSVIILINEYRIHKNNKIINKIRADSIIIAHRIEGDRERLLISEVLKRVTKGRTSPQVIYRLTDIIYRSSKNFGYDPILLLAVIEVESFYDVNAYGRYKTGEKSGALGIMQLKPETAREVAGLLKLDSLSQIDLFNPEHNIVLGVAYLTTMIARFKSFKLGLIAYNEGPGEVIKKINQKIPLSLNYYQKVLNVYYKLTKISTEVSSTL
ncbi:MAG: transglycosylase SLT domain-containing protein [Chitinispirillaceae bacterium]|nr:transglycosylase SLT domain-containing protein [Chitinispirillaceae bacterium]